MSPPSFFKDYARLLPSSTRDYCRSHSTATSNPSNPPLSSKCPFSIRRLNSTTHLIRENDAYGEYPNIYVKLATARSRLWKPRHILVLSDTGCGTESENPEVDSDDPEKGPEKWNLRTFLNFTLNPGEKFPYLVMTTHCHFDHILGIEFLPPTCAEKCHHGISVSSGQSPAEPVPGTGASSHLTCTGCRGAHGRNVMDLPNSPPTTVLSSSHSPGFITPYSHLTKHSLCPTVHRSTPRYTVGIWAHDGQSVIYNYSDDEAKSVMMDTHITILHTPGHTPDSLTWYDAEERCISVGDSLYEQESPDSKAETEGGSQRGWEREPAMPTIFNNESDLVDWWESLKKVISFVREKNKEVDESEQSPVESNMEDAEIEPEDDEWVLVQPYQFKSPRQRMPKPQATRKPKLKPRLTLSAAHVTAEVDAEICLVDMQTFMARILRSEVPFRQLDELEGGKPVGYWDDLILDAQISPCDDAPNLQRNRYLPRPPPHWPQSRRHEWHPHICPTCNQVFNRPRDMEFCRKSHLVRGQPGKDVLQRLPSSHPWPGEERLDPRQARGRFSVRSPLWVIVEGRKRIPKEEWGGNE